MAFEKHLVTAVNECAADYDMKISIGGNVYVLGYPLRFSHFVGTPIWKRGTIASEPHMEDEKAEGRVVIDATTRQGMSGSPVILRAQTHYETQNGDIVPKPRAMRFIGIYASRPGVVRTSDIDPDDPPDVRHEVGFFYKSQIVSDAIEKGRLARNYGEWPD